MNGRGPSARVSGGRWLTLHLPKAEEPALWRLDLGEAGSTGFVLRAEGGRTILSQQGVEPVWAARFANARDAEETLRILAAAYAASAAPSRLLSLASLAGLFLTVFVLGLALGANARHPRPEGVPPTASLGPRAPDAAMAPEASVPTGPAPEIARPSRLAPDLPAAQTTTPELPAPLATHARTEPARAEGAVPPEPAPSRRDPSADALAGAAPAKGQAGPARDMLRPPEPARPRAGRAADLLSPPEG